MKLIVAVVLSLASTHLVQAQAVYSQGYGPVSCPAPTATSPVWGKLVLSGNSVTCFYAVGAASPTTWTQLGPPQTISFLNDPLLVGIYCTAHDGTVLSTGTIDNFSISPAPKYRLADSDIGAPSLMGSANLVGSTWTISSSGTDIWGTADQFNFQPWLVWGNCTVVCRVTSLSTVGSSWQKIGVMIRDGYNSGSDYALFCATCNQGVAFQYRTAFNNNPDQTLLVAPPAPGTTAGISIGYGQTGTTSYVLRP